ncbi:MAG: carbamate kinase [Candidatus Phosphoribacter sp.]
MRIVVALGGNALLRRGEPMTADVQRANVQRAAAALAPLAADHELVITHGNGPQVGLLALQAQAYQDVEPYPLDLLGAQTDGMIGYLIEQELGNLLPEEQPLATLLTMTEVDPDDPAFADPTKFVGPVYDEPAARRLADEQGWTVKPDGPYWRRVVASPAPQRIFEIRPVDLLLRAGCVVICTGGGGIPTMFARDEAGARTNVLTGVEAVVDKDLASGVLARELGADVFVMATDVAAVYTDFGMPSAREIAAARPEWLLAQRFPAGSMGPKIQAATDFATATGRPACIGALEAIGDLLDGRAGTQVSTGLAAPIQFR